MPGGLVSSSWHGPLLEAKMDRAVGRAAVAIGENVTVEGKRLAPVLTGTLRRSIHSAPVGYGGGGDEGEAAGGDLGNTQDATRVGPLVAAVEAGSWIAYACVVETRRKYMTPAVEIVRGARCDAIVRAAVSAEGL